MPIRDGDRAYAPGAVLTHEFRGTREWLVGPELRALLGIYVAKWATRYKAVVAKDTGRLKRSTQVDFGVYVGKENALTGYVKATARHAAPHEFGWTDRLGFRHAGAHELRSVMMGL